jgi:hypothetical protein
VTGTTVQGTGWYMVQLVARGATAVVVSTVVLRVTRVLILQQGISLLQSSTIIY